GQHGVAVRVDRRGRRLPPRIGLPEAVVQLLPWGAAVAAQADDAVEAAVQLDHSSGARGLVQAVDVLRDAPGEEAASLEGGDRAMPGVGSRPRDVPPAEMAARPVPAAGRRAAEK